jgi:predicted TIM-barrel fold metal-dependent hydrolase
MLRRDFLAGGGSLIFAGSVHPRLAFGQTTYLPAKIIDVHCHVFNAYDLPMVDFIDKSMIRAAFDDKKAKPYEPVVDSILKDVAGRLQRAAKNEDKYLDEIKADPHKARTRDAIQRSEREFVIALFREWHDKPGKRLPSGTPLTVEIVNSYLPRIALGFIRRELLPAISVPVNYSLGAALDNSDGAFDLDDANSDPEYLAGLIYDNVNNGQLCHTIKWVVSFTRYRRELLADLNRVNHGRAVLVTPALVDFTKWLDASETSMTIPKQLALMSQLSRQRPAELPHLHGFVPFDPLRQAIYDKAGGPADDSPLAIVEKAIMQQGFIGVKLYPPMGFRASDNVSAGNDFPCWVRFGKGSPGYDETCSGRRNGSDGLGNEPGAVLDAAMMKLFEWCAANNVPIMAHTNNSNGAGPGYGTRANPKYWQPVLQKFPTLHVNFAHFGGFNEAFAKGQLDLTALNKTWEWTIGRMAAAAPDRPIFADISYFSEILDRHSQLRKDTLACIQRFRDTFPNSEKLLLYGTDWSMIGHEEKFITSAEYLPDIVAEFLSEAGYDMDDCENIFFRNAVRFLGLRNTDKNSTRGRLERFYQTPAESVWLGVFDGVA